MIARRLAARLHHEHGAWNLGCFGVAQLDAALAVADRFVDLAGVEIRHLERIEDGDLLAMALDILRGLHDRLVVALHVGKRCDQRLLQAGDVWPAAN